MKDFSPLSLWAIAEELLGAGPLWIGVCVAALFVLLFVIAMVRRHGIHGAAARFGVRAGLIVAVAVAIAAPFATQATFENLHGGVDWLALGVLALLAFAGTFVAVYGLFGLNRRA